MYVLMCEAGNYAILGGLNNRRAVVQVVPWYLGTSPSPFVELADACDFEAFRAKCSGCLAQRRCYLKQEDIGRKKNHERQ